MDPAASGTFYGMTASLWHAPLDQFQSDVAAALPAPAGVATTCVAAALGLSLLVKVLRITGKRQDLLPEALELIGELRAAADADVAGVRAYIQTRDTRALHEVPTRAAHLMAKGLTLCASAAEAVDGLIAADIAAATALLQGAESAVQACIAANSR